MGAKHNLPSLENTMMDSPDWDKFYGGGGVAGGGGEVGKQFLIVLILCVPRCS